jgi:hypothetical protein
MPFPMLSSDHAEPVAYSELPRNAALAFLVEREGEADEDGLAALVRGAVRALVREGGATVRMMRAGDGTGGVMGVGYHMSECTMSVCR